MLRTPYAATPPWVMRAFGGHPYRLWERQDAHSLYLAVAALLLAVTLVIDLIFHREVLNVWLLWALLLVCIGGSVIALLLGPRFPRWAGLLSVGTFIGAQVYFMSDFADVQSAISALQELPILSFYLGWFIRPLPARLLMVATQAMLAATMIPNPAFAPDGPLGVPSAVHGMVGAMLCFEIGSYLRRRVEQRAHTDQLTGALNRRGLMARLENELRPRLGATNPLTLVVVDFDDFKLLNDTLGHAAGDSALREAVSEWRAGIRARDLIGRTGGDEFVLLLRRTGLAGAVAVMSRLRRDSAHEWSWGASEAAPGDTPESLIRRADLALYRQKRARQA
ncbi:GGDEF domain-containing protein [Leucobacter sp. CSA1]|uniref:GGDEF domain-containing protein n=1 Tax=Leucobacter chromiisoli TaxID=2796471 RepID=A0A934QAF1_9MICO|nr:GGDEF domain-containing protein [Leucobacter chromiisoli]MBK0419712.1 GGDEF domain-containing protein [Leucobacter chromiisoli]